MNKFEKKEEQPLSLALSDVPMIDKGRELVQTKKQLKEIVELPLLAACEDLYDKNIRTLASSANKKDIAAGQAHILIDFDSLSEENKQIARKFAAPKQDDGHWGGGKTIFITIPLSASSTVDEISRHAVSIARAFQWQPATWIPKRKPESFAATLNQLKESFCLESPEYDDPNSAAWKRLGYDYDSEKKIFYSIDRLEWYYDPKTETYYPSDELCKKASQKQPH